MIGEPFSQIDPRELSDPGVSESGPDFLQMYDVPGNEPVTQVVLKRYQKDKTQYQDQITQLAQSSPLSVESVPEIERAEMLKHSLASNNIDVQAEAVGMIWAVPEPEQAELERMAAAMIDQALKSEDASVQAKAAEMIDLITEPECTELKIKALQSDNIVVQTKIIEMMENVSESIHVELIEAALQSSHPSIQIKAAERIQYLTEFDQADLELKALEIIESALQSDDMAVQAEAAGVIWAAPEIERVDLIKQALQSNNIDVQAKAASAMWSAPDSEQSELEQIALDIVKQALQSDDVLTQAKACNMILHIPRSEWNELIEQASGHNDIAIQSELVKIVWRLPKSRWTESEQTVVENIKLALQSDNEDIQSQAISIIQKAPEAEQAELVQLITGKPAANLLVASSLYQGQTDLEHRPLARERFAKTGSETILLGGDLEGKVIIRRVDPAAFLTWQNLYENHQLWLENDFNYVPIEPIVSFHPNKSNFVDVASGVLDLSLADYLANGWGKFKSELGLDRVKILDILNTTDITHGHSHFGNFCLRFYRDQNGIVDLERKPRLYLIDFDQSIQHDFDSENDVN